jgi:hypothetical protein
MLYVRHVHLKKTKPIHKGQTQLLVREDFDRQGTVAKKISNPEPQGVLPQDELLGSKQPVVK